MAPSGYKNLTLSVRAYEKVLRGRTKLLQRGINAVPAHLMPPEHKGATAITLDMVVEIGMLAMDAALKKEPK